MIEFLRLRWKVVLVSLGIVASLVFVYRTTLIRPASPKTDGHLERLLDNPGKISFSVAADSERQAGARGAGSYYWTARQLRQNWTRLPDSGPVTWRSPELGYDGLDEIHSIVIRLSPDTDVRSFNLHWGESPNVDPLVLGRNNRALTRSGSVGGDDTLLVLGQDISATQELDPLANSSRPRYFFLRFESRNTGHLPFESVRILSQSSLFALQPHGRTRHDVRGHIRDALYTAAPGEAIYRTSLQGPSYLSFGVQSLVQASAVRYSVRADAAGASTTLFDRRITEQGKWHDFRVPIPFDGTDVVFTFRAESDGAGNTAFWANPRIVPAVREKQTNVVLYLADALRADRLGLYGYPKAVSPFLDRLAGKGTVFLNCYSTAAWTKPSVTSLLTSLHPQTHGVGLRSNTDILPETTLTLQDYFRSRGYVTAHLSANPLGSTLSNLDQGFDSVFTTAFFEPPGERPPKVRSDAMIDIAHKWIDDHQDEPLFLYIHAMDTHSPYSKDQLPASFRGKSADDGDAALYDAEVHYTDQQIQRLYAHLTGLGLADHTLFIVTSDHGEAFGEHGRTGHGTSVYQEEIRVPLLMIHEGIVKPERVEEPVSLIDVMPTVLSHCSIPFDRANVQGLNVLSPRERRRDRRILAARSIFPEGSSMHEGDVFALIQRNQKLIVKMTRDAREPALELYNLADDPSESRNLADTQKDVAKELYSGLLDFLDRQGKLRSEFVAAHEKEQDTRPTEADEQSIPHDVIERLRSLGYL